MVVNKIKMITLRQIFDKIIMGKKQYHYNQNSRKRFSLVERLEKAKEIWELRITQNLTLEAIGKQKGITRERARQILLWYKEYMKI